MPPRETKMPITMAGMAEPGTPTGLRSGILSRMEVHCILSHMALPSQGNGAREGIPSPAIVMGADDSRVSAGQRLSKT